jgi:phage/plasmid-like protein (TIGR03299 family)
MSHQIEQFTDGSAAFVSARQDAWHRLGTVLPDTFTAEQALEVAKLGGWNVEKAPLYTRVLTSTGFAEVEIPGQFVTTRTNPVTKDQEVIGIEHAPSTVGKVYRPFQNEQLCEFLNALVDEGGAHFETAGSLRGGSDVFVTLRLPENILVGGVDPINLNLAVLNNHIGTASIRALVTPTRIVCANTQAAAIRNAKSQFKIRHTATADQRVQEAREALGLTFAYIEGFQAEADRLIDQAYTDAEFEKLVDQLWTPADADKDTKRTVNSDAERRNTLRSLWSDADTNALIRGTKWGAYQAVTEYLDHNQPVRVKGDKDIARAERVASGQYDDVKVKAFDILAGAAA